MRLLGKTAETWASVDLLLTCLTKQSSDRKKAKEETLELCGADDDDVRDVEEDDTVIVYAEPDQFHQVQEAFKQAGVEEFTVAEITMLPQNEVTLDDESKAQFEKLIDVLEELEDVQQVYHNVDLGE